ncbi:MAG TPA: S1 RNA-binding domain-containing protein [Patescibacteria group bacterium]|nr:S1 RNA-binding domain-containing protein [Patescibacteria group bacterium]
MATKKATRRSAEPVDKPAKAAVKKPRVKKVTPKKVEVNTSTSSVRVRAVPKVETKAESLMDRLMAKAGATLVTPKRGQQVEGTVTFVSRRMVLVNIGAKTEGVVADAEAKEASDIIESLKVGDPISVFIKHPENDQGQILLSLRKAVEEGRWSVFKKWMDEDREVEVAGLEVNKGGMVVKIGEIRGFVPASQFGEKHLGNMEELLGKTFKAKVIEVDKAQNRLIFSEKLVSDAEGLAKKDEALADVVAGAKLVGTVSGIMPFGVFVTVNVPVKGKAGLPAVAMRQLLQAGEVAKVEGLVHISEISWEKVDDPNTMFKVGQEVSVMVIGIEKEAGKLNLSIKQLSGDPWSDIETKYAVGTKHQGKVFRIAAYGVFVNFERGIDGLIHVSKQPQGKEFAVGETVDVYVEMLDAKSRRMSLGVVLTEVPVEYR